MNLEEFLTLTLDECPLKERKDTGLLLVTAAVYSLISDAQEDVLQFSMPKKNYSKEVLNDLGIQMSEQENGVLIKVPIDLFQEVEKKSVKVAVKR